MSQPRHTACGSGRPFEDRIALVTGASRGIGREVARLLAAQGGRVAVNYLQDDAAAQETLRLIEEAGGQALTVRADVSDPVQAHFMVATVVARWGRIDVLVNNAAVTRNRLLTQMRPEDVEEVLRINVLGTLYTTQAAATHMLRERWGRIVNLSSSAADRPGSGQAVYAASKGAVEAFTRAMAVELAPRDVLVNAVAPGVVEEAGVSAERRQHTGREIMDRLLLKRYGEAREVAEVVAFLASPANRYMTGEVLYLDGGFKMS